jgi:hypothetical protein
MPRGSRAPAREEDVWSVRLANGFLGLWLPGAWELPASANAAPIRLDGGGRQHLVFCIESKHADEALANLRRHGVRYYGPRVKENGEVHLDFEPPPEQGGG